MTPEQINDIFKLLSEVLTFVGDISLQAEKDSKTLSVDKEKLLKYTQQLSKAFDAVYIERIKDKV